MKRARAQNLKRARAQNLKRARGGRTGARNGDSNVGADGLASRLGRCFGFAEVPTGDPQPRRPAPELFVTVQDGQATSRVKLLHFNCYYGIFADLACSVISTVLLAGRRGRRPLRCSSSVRPAATGPHAQINRNAVGVPAGLDGGSFIRLSVRQRRRKKGRRTLQRN